MSVTKPDGPTEDRRSVERRVLLKMQQAYREQYVREVSNPKMKESILLKLICVSTKLGDSSREMLHPADTLEGAHVERTSAMDSGEITENLQPVVAELAALVAQAVEAVPGADALSPEELGELLAEVLAGK